LASKKNSCLTSAASCIADKQLRVLSQAFIIKKTSKAAKRRMSAIGNVNQNNKKLEQL